MESHHELERFKQNSQLHEVYIYYSKFDMDHFSKLSQHSSGERIFKILVDSCLEIIRV